MAGYAVKLGERYRDELTGWEGVATARTDFLYGCVRVGLEGPNADGQPVEEWFDEQRLVRAEDGAKPTPTATSGGRRTTPARRSTRRR